MKPYRVGRWLCALVILAAAGSPAEAAWDNVFQVCGTGCCPEHPILARLWPARYGCCKPACCASPACGPVCAPACAPVCTTQYVQRSYYQPVTCYQTQTYYEPCTNYRTSYYYEPCTSYRYSCYYDPCTCSYQQVACPVTSYRLRSQTCAVTSYLQRTCCVPVTSYRLSYYMEPVTTCCAPPACPSPCVNGAAPVAVPRVGEQPAAPAPASPSPGVYEQRTAPPAGSGSGNYDRYYPAQPSNPQPNTPPAQGSNYRQVPPAVPQSSPPPTVKLDRIVVVPKAGSGSIDGQVVHQDNAPRGGVHLTFVRAGQEGTQQPVTADQAGQFRVSLAAGGWLVYLTGSDGKPVYHSQIEIRGEESRQITLVSR
jgi:hypothetical protein